MDFVQRGRNYRVLTDEQMGGLSRERSLRVQVECDKRARREIANSNERRRMQSINSGFQRIKSLLPRSHDKDKMSKSAILHQAVEYINRLEQEKQSISQQNEELLSMLQMVNSKTLSIPLTKRRKDDDDDTMASNLVLLSPDSVNNYGQNNVTTVALGQLQELVRSLKEQLQRERQYRESAEKRADEIQVLPKLECAIEEAVEEQVVTSACHELPSVVTLPLLVAEHEANLLNDSRELHHDRAAVARRNLETIVKAIHHVEGSVVLTEMMQQIRSRGDESLDRTERTLRFCVPPSLPLPPLRSVSEDGRNSESGGQIPATLNAVSIPLSAQRSQGESFVMQPLLAQRLC